MPEALLYGKQYEEKHRPVIRKVIEQLHKHKIVVRGYGPYVEQWDSEDRKHVAGRINTTEELRKSDTNWVISLGGDGTILSSITLVHDCKVEIVGINLGRLGYLANLEKNKIEQAIQELATGLYTTEERSLLRLDATPYLFGEDNIALNDFTILKRDNSSMITINTYVNGEFLNSYWGDGLIVSTPTGSTGYSLSCGGPIVDPICSSIILTPVAPHHLSVRPVLLNDDVELTFEIEGRADSFMCTLDSRFEVITSEYKLKIKKNPYGIRLVKFPGISFLDTMRKKLLWGTDVRSTKGKKT